MISCSSIEVRRCRPLLGTFVEITAIGSDETALHRVAHQAFAEIKRIQDLMSVHDPESELSLLNLEAENRPVTVSRETFEVLRCASWLAVESKGAFDFTVAPILARWGILPEVLQRENPGNWRNVLLLRGRQVRFLRPLALDLGGIAKGFAVDKAIETLRRGGVMSAVVNAGGDLRVFGAPSFTVHLRHPSCPQILARTIAVQEAALATSSPCFTERRWGGRRVSHLVNPLRRSAVIGVVSVTVRARQCWLADALTKVVLNAPQLAQQLLAKYEAEAFMFTA